MLVRNEILGNSNRPNLQPAIVIFVDNVVVLTIENCLLCLLEHIFTGNAVLGIDDQRIREMQQSH